MKSLNCNEQGILLVLLINDVPIFSCKKHWKGLKKKCHHSRRADFSEELSLSCSHLDKEMTGERSTSSNQKNLDFWKLLH